MLNHKIFFSNINNKKIKIKKSTCMNKVTKRLELQHNKNDNMWFIHLLEQSFQEGQGFVASGAGLQRSAKASIPTLDYWIPSKPVLLNHSVISFYNILHICPSYVRLSVFNGLNRIHAATFMLLCSSFHICPVSSEFYNIGTHSIPLLYIRELFTILNLHQFTSHCTEPCNGIPFLRHCCIEMTIKV